MADNTKMVIRTHKMSLQTMWQKFLQGDAILWLGANFNWTERKKNKGKTNEMITLKLKSTNQIWSKPRARLMQSLSYLIFLIALTSWLSLIFPLLFITLGYLIQIIISLLLTVITLSCCHCKFLVFIPIFIFKIFSASFFSFFTAKLTFFILCHKKVNSLYIRRMLKTYLL